MTQNSTVNQCACCADAFQGSGLIDPHISPDFPVCPPCHKRLRLANAHLHARAINPCKEDIPANRWKSE